MISKDNNDHRGTWNTYLCKNTLKYPVENEKDIQMGNKIGENHMKWQDENRKVWKCQRVKAGNKIRQQYTLITHTLPELESLLSGLHPGDFATKWVLFHVLTGNKSQCTMCWVYYVIMASLDSVQNIRLITQTPTRGSERVDVRGVYTWWEYEHKSREYSFSVRRYDWFLLMLCGMFAEFYLQCENKMFCSYQSNFS